MSFTGLDVDLDRIAEICQRYGVARLEVFGSVSAAARSALTATSTCCTNWRLVLDWAGRSKTSPTSSRRRWGDGSTSVSRRALHARLRDVVLAEARLLYAA